MQLAVEKKVVNRSKKLRELASPFSSFSVSIEPGKTGVVKTMPVKFEKKSQRGKTPDFSGWNMPEQEHGVIKCREHDFL
jgi:hypothetical protein